MKKKKGFTLAEVLIVISIIGIVAQMTIPTLIGNINDSKYKSMWKKEYSVLSQAISNIAQENGGSAKGIFTNSTVGRDTFAKYLSVVKSCDQGASFGNCWAANYKRLDGGIHNWTDTAGVVLSDGSSLMFVMPWGANCDAAINILSNVCGYIPVDVNGPLKGPNVIGKDIFSVWLLDTRIMPEGTMQDGRQGNSDCINKTGSGTDCSAYFLNY